MPEGSFYKDDLEEMLARQKAEREMKEQELLTIEERQKIEETKKYIEAEARKSEDAYRKQLEQYEKDYQERSRRRDKERSDIPDKIAGKGHDIITDTIRIGAMLTVETLGTITTIARHIHYMKETYNMNRGHEMELKQIERVGNLRLQNDVSLKQDYQNSNREIQRLETQRESLGMFKGKERQQIDKQLHTLYEKVKEIHQVMKDRGIQSVTKLDEEIKDTTRKLDVVKEKINEISVSRERDRKFIDEASRVLVNRMEQCGEVLDNREQSLNNLKDRVNEVKSLVEQSKEISGKITELRDIRDDVKTDIMEKIDCDKKIGELQREQNIIQDRIIEKTRIELPGHIIGMDINAYQYGSDRIRPENYHNEYVSQIRKEYIQPGTQAGHTPQEVERYISKSANLQEQITAYKGAYERPTAGEYEKLGLGIKIAELQEKQKDVFETLEKLTGIPQPFKQEQQTADQVKPTTPYNEVAHGNYIQKVEEQFFKQYSPIEIKQHLDNVQKDRKELQEKIEKVKPSLSPDQQNRIRGNEIVPREQQKTITQSM